MTDPIAAEPSGTWQPTLQPGERIAARPLAADWSYRPPYSPGSYSHQLWYRTTPAKALGLAFVDAGGITLSLVRRRKHPAAELLIQHTCGCMQVALDPTGLLTLRDAINDALNDIKSESATNEPEARLCVSLP